MNYFIILAMSFDLLNNISKFLKVWMLYHP